jgi:hypothetical protein
MKFLLSVIPIAHPTGGEAREVKGRTKESGLSTGLHGNRSATHDRGTRGSGESCLSHKA